MSESRGRPREYTDDEILDHIRRVADGNRPPTWEEFNADADAPWCQTVQRHFGSWAEAVEAAGFDPVANQGSQIPREELVSWLQAFRLEIGAWPRRNDLRDWPGPSATPYRRAFESWDDAIAAAKEGMDDE